MLRNNWMQSNEWNQTFYHFIAPFHRNAALLTARNCDNLIQRMHQGCVGGIAGLFGGRAHFCLVFHLRLDRKKTGLPKSAETFEFGHFGRNHMLENQNCSWDEAPERKSDLSGNPICMKNMCHTHALVDCGDWLIGIARGYHKHPWHGWAGQLSKRNNNLLHPPPIHLQFLSPLRLGLKNNLGGFNPYLKPMGTPILFCFQ